MTSPPDGKGAQGQPVPGTAQVQRPQAPQSSSAPPAADRKAATPSPSPPPSPSRPLTPRSPRVALEPERVPQLTRRSKRVRHPLVVAGNAVFTALVLFTIALGAALFIGKQRFDAPGPLAQDTIVNIPRGLGMRGIAESLEREGVIDQPFVFLGGVIALKARGDLKHGEYKFSAHASMADVVEAMIEGKVLAHLFTVPEGLTSEQVVARLLADPALTGDDQGHSARGHAVARHLQIQPRHDARADDPPHAAGA